MNNTSSLTTHPSRGVFALAAAALALAASAAFAAAASEPTAFSVAVTGNEHGRPMILIPGLASPGAVWDGTVARFQDEYQCHTISLGGFGGEAPAPLPAGSTSLLATVREELAHYIQDRGLNEPVVVGHSLGGFVALDLAVHHPALPGALVIVDSLPFLIGVMQPDATLEDARRIASATTTSFANADPETYARMIRGGPNGSTMATRAADVDRIIAWGLASDAATVARAMHELYTSDLRAQLASIQAPTLVLAAWAGYAPYSSHELIEKVYRGQYAGLPDFRLEITDTARHFIMLDEPEWTCATIIDFLKPRAR